MSRPWSPAEIEQKIPQIVDALDDARAELLELGVSAATAERDYRRAKSIAIVKAANQPGPRGTNNADVREAKALTAQARPGVTVNDLRYQRDLAKNAYWDQRTSIEVLRTEADLLRTLNVSGRENGR